MHRKYRNKNIVQTNISLTQWALEYEDTVWTGKLNDKRIQLHSTKRFNFRLGFYRAHRKSREFIDWNQNILHCVPLGTTLETMNFDNTVPANKYSVLQQTHNLGNPPHLYISDRLLYMQTRPQFLCFGSCQLTPCLCS
jgi:hypothetical protein